MSDRHVARVSGLLVALSIIATTTYADEKGHFRIVVTEQDAPKWCLAASVDAPLRGGDWRRTLAEFWIKEFLDHRRGATNASSELMRRIGDIVRKDSAPVFIVSDPKIAPKRLGLSNRIRSVSSFDQLHGDRWEIELTVDGVRGKAPADAQMLAFTWTRIREAPGSIVADNMRGEIEVHGTQEYCALRVGSEIRVSLIGSSSH